MIEQNIFPSVLYTRCETRKSRVRFAIGGVSAWGRTQLFFFTLRVQKLGSFTKEAFSISVASEPARISFWIWITEISWLRIKLSSKMPGSCEVCSSEPSKYRCPICALMRYELLLVNVWQFTSYWPGFSSLQLLSCLYAVSQDLLCSQATDLHWTDWIISAKQRRTTLSERCLEQRTNNCYRNQKQ